MRFGFKPTLPDDFVQVVTKRGSTVSRRMAKKGVHMRTYRIVSNGVTYRRNPTAQSPYAACATRQLYGVPNSMHCAVCRQGPSPLAKGIRQGPTSALQPTSFNRRQIGRYPKANPSHRQDTLTQANLV